ncbi:unnamed protein product [Rotaria magnacalcarata]|uniref:Uncharacterized protein n=2 Tax=Rotaria magnacalcarata TaxID=392030 RepID=A0A816M3S9_9BILA|nr:unnamed protein product [Rotaria magnacalcarata]CAF2089818.1 unnamed protein product [Rotaria magnacalcarata]CAF2152450.1 unnamed protein product [Rotaria magnacalcarata]
MRIKGVIILTFALLFAVIGLVLHLLALFSKQWTVAIPRERRGPNDQIHYYSLWTRCQYSNTSFVIPDISSQPNIENFVCRPNTYLRYNMNSEEISKKCYSSRHQCSSIIGVHPDCKCKYLPVTQVQQWCCILAAIFLFLAVLILYLNLIASPQNESATLLLTFAPMVLISLALILMVITMILLGAYLRRNEYEDYDIKLAGNISHSLPMAPETFNLYRLDAFFKIHKNPDLRRQAVSIFKTMHKERFDARVYWSVGVEIAAILVTFMAYILSIILALARLIVKLTMQIRGVVIVTLALFLGIGALVLHLLAMCSPRWKVTKRDVEPIMAPVSYGLWQRCEYSNITISKQGVSLGTRPNVELCRPNHYMRYSPDKYDLCYHRRRGCPVTEPANLPEGCSCRYLPSAKGLQWLTIYATIFLILGLLLLYLKTITSPQNDSAVLVLSFGPFACFLLTLLFMITTLILVGAYLRRDTYEDYTFPLRSISNDSKSLLGFELHSLRNYAKHFESKVPYDQYIAAERELRTDANTHYHTTIGRATVFEISATVLILIVNALTFLLASASRSDDV